MTRDEHAGHIGAMVSNFQSLEFILRLFLLSRSARPTGVPFGTDIYSCPIGTELPENELTSFDTLGQLIGKYNSEMAKVGQAPIDTTLVDIRDALAHGRVSAAVAGDDLRLLKFSKPVNGRVRIIFNETLSVSWFNEQKTRVVEAMMSVHANLK